MNAELIIQKASNESLSEMNKWVDEQKQKRQATEELYQKKKKEGKLTDKDISERQKGTEKLKKEVGQISRQTVKTYIGRTAKGKLRKVPTHTRTGKHKTTSEQIKDIKAKKGAKKKEQDLNKLVKDRIKSKKKQNEIIQKYLNPNASKRYPANVNIMLNGKWKSELRKKSKTIKGKKVIATHSEQRLVASPKQWEQILKENGGLVNKIVKRYGFNRDLHDDMKQEGYRAIFDAVNSYGDGTYYKDGVKKDKYDPSDPYDLQKQMASYIAGYVNAELGRQMATRITLPMYKKKIMTRFKEAVNEYGYDYDKIYDKLKLKKSDLYPSMNRDEDALLPRDGYVTIAKHDKIDKDRIAYEKNVNKLTDDYDKKRNSLRIRREYGMDEDSKQIYLDGLSEYDKKISAKKKEIRDSSTKRKQSGKGERATMRKVIADYENKRQAYVEEFKPIHEEDFNDEMQLIDRRHQTELTDLREEYDKQTDKTTVPGAYELFREFEEIDSFSYFNTSATKRGDEGQKENLEQYISGHDLSVTEQIDVTTRFIIARDRFMKYFENMDDKTSKVLKLHLGLDKDNDLYGHGLWGEPMQTLTEIEKLLPKGFYKKETGEVKEYKKRYTNWKDKKPSRLVKTKKDKTVVAKEIKVWEGRKTKAKNAYKIAVGKLEKKGKRLTVPQKKDIRERLYKKTKSGWSDRPQIFTEKRMTPKQLELAMLQWKNLKPRRELSGKSIRDRIATDLEVGKRILARTMPKDVMRGLLHTYGRAKSGGAEISDRYADYKRTGKLMLKAMIRDMSIISKACGYEPIYVIKKKLEAPKKNIITRAIDAIKQMADKLIGK